MFRSRDQSVKLQSERFIYKHGVVFLLPAHLISKLVGFLEGAGKKYILLRADCVRKLTNQCSCQVLNKICVDDNLIKTTSLINAKGV